MRRCTMNPDGTFDAEDDYHISDVSEDDRKRLHYLKKQQLKEARDHDVLKKEHAHRKHKHHHREHKEPRDPRVLKASERSGRGMASKHHRDAPDKVNSFKEHLHATADDRERQRNERRQKKAEAKAQKIRALRQTVVEDDDMPACEDLSGWNDQEAGRVDQVIQAEAMVLKDSRCREKDVLLTIGGGCCGSVKVPITVQAGLPALALRLLDLDDRDLAKHWLLFDQAAGDDGEISHDEFFDLIDVDPTTFLKCLVDAIVFDWADLDKDHTLNFSEFLLASCVMCTLTHRQLAFFVFTYFDADDDGQLDYPELQHISHAMEGSRFGGDMAKFLHVCDVIQDEHGNHHPKETRKMGFVGFLEACHRCSLVVHPIMRLQRALVLRTLGAQRWARLQDDYGAGAARAGLSDKEGGGDFHHEMSAAGLLLLAEKSGRPLLLNS